MATWKNFRISKKPWTSLEEIYKADWAESINAIFLCNTGADTTIKIKIWDYFLFHDVEILADETKIITGGVNERNVTPVLWDSFKISCANSAVDFTFFMSRV